ncbi:hypothetical protein EYC45_05160 [Pseudoxanthomonas winnipegensis]|nr:hypothetical protein EYC45_05160 [Pseudoxanthomonas winnipegensis]
MRQVGAAEGEATLAQGVTWLALAPRSMAHSRQARHLTDSARSRPIAPSCTTGSGHARLFSR